jgi:hypothetical protein
MIKRQYNRFDFGSYFNNFVAYHNTVNTNAAIETALKPYKATLAKSKKRHARLNVKWHDPQLYVMFVLRWT